MDNIAIPRSEIEGQVIEAWLQEQMTKDVVKQGWYAEVTMGFSGIATVIWDVAYDYRTTFLNMSVVLGTAWLDTRRNVACWECNATEDLPKQSNDVGFGPVLPPVKRNSKSQCEHFAD